MLMFLFFITIAFYNPIDANERPTVETHINSVYRHFSTKTPPPTLSTSSHILNAIAFLTGIFKFVDGTIANDYNTDPDRTNRAIAPSLFQTAPEHARTANSDLNTKEIKKKSKITEAKNAIIVAYCSSVLLNESTYYIKRGANNNQPVAKVCDWYTAASICSPMTIAAPAFCGILISPKIPLLLPLLFVPGVAYATTNRLIHAHQEFTKNNNGLAAQHACAALALAGSFAFAYQFDWCNFFR